MDFKSVLVFCLLAIVGLAMKASEVTAETCKQHGCHAHSAGDWCNKLGPGYKVRSWKHCSFWGEKEYCCKK